MWYRDDVIESDVIESERESEWERTNERVTEREQTWEHEWERKNERSKWETEQMRKKERKREREQMRMKEIEWEKEFFFLPCLVTFPKAARRIFSLSNNFKGNWILYFDLYF